MRTRSSTWRGTWGAIALSGLLMTSCGGSSGGTQPPAFNATGHWQTWLTDPSTMEESGPYGSYLTQNGSGYVDGVGVTGLVSGSTLNIQVAIPGLPAAIQFTGTASGLQVLGSYQMFGFPVQATFRMEPFGPNGQLVTNGTVGGLAVSINTTTAFGERKYADEGLTMLTGVNVVDDDGQLRFELNFEPSSLAVGVLDASVETVQVYAGNDVTDDTVIALSGTVTISQYDASGFVATFNLTLPGAEAVSGSFGVVYDLNAYEP